MASSRQSIKRARQAITRRLRTRAIRTRLRSVIKQVRQDISTDIEVAKKSFRTMQSVADSTARKGLVPVPRVARLKKRINQALLKAVNATKSN